MTYLIWAYHAWSAIPRRAKWVIVLLVAVAAIYVFGDCHGRAVQRQQDTTPEEARRIAVLAHMREAVKDTARAERDSAQVRRDTLTRTITRFVTIRASEPTVIPDADHDTLHVRYRDGTVRLLPVSDPVDSLVHSLVSQLALADTTIQRAKVANDADSVAIAKLWHASVAADSLISEQQQALRNANDALARCRPSTVGKVVRVVEWAALAYAGAKVYQTLRH